MRHLAYGLLVETDVPLPLPAADDDRPADVLVRSERIDTPGLVFGALGGGATDGDWMRLASSPQRLVLAFSGVTAEVSLVSATITVDVHDTDDDDYVAHIVLDHVLPRYLYLAGDVVLHGGSVASPAGQVVAFIGSTGKGKSSLVTALAGAGWKLLGDDACRLVWGAEGWAAYPSYRGVRLNAASRAALVPDSASAPMGTGADKHRVVPPVEILTTPLPLGLVVELGGERAPATWRRMLLGEATAALTRHSFCLAGRAGSLSREVFLKSSAVAAAVPCVQLEYRRSWDVYPEVIELLGTVEATSP